jgi:NTE family protein
MRAWDGKLLRKKNSLCLSVAERALIRSKFPKASDGNIYIDSVFQGGGVRGFAFLGALRCLDDAGIRIRKVAGTSAGAITAAAVATKATSDELESLMAPLDFNTFLTKKTSSLIWNGNPNDDLENMAVMLANLTLVGRMGQYSTDPFYKWMKEALKGKLDTFKAPVTEGEWHEKTDLKIVVSDITDGEMRVLPTDLNLYGLDPLKFEVAEAVRLSMSIPLFFEPGTLSGRTVVDGGILSNFPMWIFDAKEGTPPNCPTIGFRLSKGSTRAPQIKTAAAVVSNMLFTMMVARDKHYMRLYDQRRVINIDTGSVSDTQFALSLEDKEVMYAQGYKATKKFLINSWDWAAYLLGRGLAPDL